MDARNGRLLIKNMVGKYSTNENSKNNKTKHKTSAQKW